MKIPKPSLEKKKRVKKPTLAKLRKQLDRLWYLKILERDKVCKKCGRKDTLAGHHIFGKKVYPAGRWNINNGILLCYAHHMFFAHSDPYRFMFWVKECKGIEWWDRLHDTVMEKQQFRSSDFERIKESLCMGLE